MKIPLTKPCVGEKERRAILEPLETGWLSQGPKVQEFENTFASYVGVSDAVACSSCTTALHLALAALGVGPGDEVLIPAFTFVATANTVEFQRGRPVFIDIDLATFNLDPLRIESQVSARTKAIIPVHLFGLSADMEPILEVASRYHLAVIEDAACGVGTKYRGRHVGGFGEAGCFSFHPRKLITTGEGGMVTTHNRKMTAHLRVLRSQGATISDLDRHREGQFVLPEFNDLGYNYRMTDIQAALGIEQMRRVEWLVEARQAKARRYSEALVGIRGLTVPSIPAGRNHTFQSFVILVGRDARVSRDALSEALQARGIATRQGTHAVHTLGYYRRKYYLQPEDFPQAWRADRESLALPLFPQIEEDEQEYVIRALQELLG